MKILGTLVTVMLMIESFGLARAEERTSLKIATEGAFPPWNSVDTSGAPVGYDIDVGNELCHRMNVTCQFVTQDWDGIIPALNVDKYDAIMAAMSITEKRKQSITFSQPYAITSNYFAIRENLKLPTSSTDIKVDLSKMGTAEAQLMADLNSKLKGRIIGVQRSTNAEAFVQQYFKSSVEVRSYDTQDNLNLDITAGRLDGGLADYSAWKVFLESRMESPSSSTDLAFPGGFSVEVSVSVFANRIPHSLQNSIKLLREPRPTVRSKN